MIPRSRLRLPILAVGVAALGVAVSLIGLMSPGPSGLAFLVFGLWCPGAPALALTFGILAIASSRHRDHAGVEAPGFESRADSLE